MTSEEEAIGLVQAFINEGFLPAAARIAALVAVDKIIDATTKRWGGINPETGLEIRHTKVDPYWIDVKKQIENT